MKIIENNNRLLGKMNPGVKEEQKTTKDKIVK